MKTFVWILVIAVVGAGAYLFYRQRVSDTTTVVANSSIMPGRLMSPAFADQQLIPEKYTCDGENMSPPLAFSDLPVRAQYVALVMEDLDASTGIFDHWVIWNVPAPTSILQLSAGTSLGVSGKNSAGKLGYTGPCPPSGEHRYRFTAYGYNQILNLKAGATKEQIQRALQGGILWKAELVGLYHH